MYTAVGDMYLPVCDFDRNVFMYVQLLGSTPCHFAHGVCILNLPVTSSRGVAKAAMLPLTLSTHHACRRDVQGGGNGARHEGDGFQQQDTVLP